MDVLQGLDSLQKAALKRGNLNDMSEVMLSQSQDIARKCKISASEAQAIIDMLYHRAPQLRVARLEDIKHNGIEACTTGDSILDRILGGGIRPGMIWEVAGESAAGKTQFALQLSLFAQLPEEQSGLCGSTCYITTSSRLPTSRLVQIRNANPLLSESDCDLKDVHTLSTPTIAYLIHVLSEKLTPFIEAQANKAGFKPVRLLVIDALAELFHTSDKTTTSTLVERSKNIAEISSLLHSLARKHRIAVLILNEVVDVFDRAADPSNAQDRMPLYSQQSRWFCRAHSVPGEDKKEASLGMVWANQVNARILLSRTGRRRYLDDIESSSVKRLKTDSSSRTAIVQANTDLALIRRFSIVFSSVSQPASLDYIVTEAGISILPEEAGWHVREDQKSAPSSNIQGKTALPNPIAAHKEDTLLSPLDMGTAKDERYAQQEAPQGIEDEEPPEDEWDDYWATNTMSQAELDALDDTPES